MRRINLPRTTLLAVVTLASLGLLATACGSSDGSDSTSTSDTGAGAAATGAAAVGSWTLTSYDTDGTETPAAASPADLEILDDGTFSGSTGCNRISGTWTGDADGAFTITPGPMTQMACVDPAVQAQETAITTGFPEVTDATVSGSTLNFDDSAGVPLFTWAAGPEGIVGSYSVTGVNNGSDAVVSSAATENASVTFAADGTVSGNTGCNSFSGSYEVDGSTITIDGEVAATMMACEGDAQELEMQFLAALANSTTWERSGAQVTLRDGTGAAQLTMTAD
jgi:heat shock protein HslJ